MNNTNTSTNTLPTASNASTKPLCKLGIDVHAATITVVRQFDGANPQRPQRFSTKEFLRWVEQLVQKYRVISCYEAGPTGYWLHRRLEKLGVTNYVVCPSVLDSRAQGVNNDNRDALELLSRLDRYLAGNRKAFSVVSVPTAEQEQKRALSRQRGQLRCQRLSLAAQGRMLLLSQGHHQGNQWWKKARWAELTPRLPQWLYSQLETFRRLILSLDEEIKKLTVEVSAAAPQQLPVGMGGLSHEIIQNEMKDFSNFNNRRQVGSYPGLTGGVSASGVQHADLSITKAGNRRLRACLVECAWRMLFHQPDYWLVKKWQHVLLNPRAHTRRKKQVIVAFARQLLIDIWKWKTGRVTPERLGWKMTDAAA